MEDNELKWWDTVKVTFRRRWSHKKNQTKIIENSFILFRSADFFGNYGSSQRNNQQSNPETSLVIL